MPDALNLPFTAAASYHSVIRNHWTGQAIPCGNGANLVQNGTAHCLARAEPTDAEWGPDIHLLSRGWEWAWHSIAVAGLQCRKTDEFGRVNPTGMLPT